MVTVNLSVPFVLKGEEVTALNLDFDKLTGNDLVFAEREARALGDSTPVLKFSMTYQAVLVAKAIGCVVDEILAMNAKDFSNLTNKVTDFLLN